MPAIVLQIIAGIQAAINAWPQIEGIVESGKALITALFKGGVITIDQQAATHAYIDGLAAMVKAGIVPPALVVRPDPGTAAPVATTDSTAAPAKS